MKTSVVEDRISGSLRTRFFQELFGNSWHFPIANILLEFLLEGPSRFLVDPALYSILTAGAIQAYFLSKWSREDRPGRRFLGNLIGVTIYTIIESLLEPGFFSSPNHLAYWVFSLVMGLMQALNMVLPVRLADVAGVAEDIFRIALIPAMYAIFEMKSNPTQTTSFGVFFSDTSHWYISILVLLIGLNLGLSNMMARYYLNLLRKTSSQLRTYSEWLLGRDLLGKIIEDPLALQLQRHDRAVLFMDIRGFTAWSEPRSPEDVVSLLNRYYQATEAILAQCRVIKFKFSADEVMVIFPTVDDGLQAALKLRTHIGHLLGRQGLGAGIGLHVGPVIEGLLGGKDVRFYDVVGDTVNTAKRIESSAAAGELLISESVRIALALTFRVWEKRQVTVKGKEEPLTVYPMA